MSRAEQELAVRSHVARDLLQNAALFKTDKLAVWEYVVNGLEYVDRGTNPEVRVELDSKRRRIRISDNGRGMEWSGPRGLENFFVMHGENIDRKEGKKGRGRFGTGKAAAFGIGDSLTITTVRGGKRSKVRLERRHVEAMSSGDAVPVEVFEREVPTDEDNGTVIEIAGIRLKSLDQGGIIRYIERHLARWPKGASVFVNNHECEYQEPPIAFERRFAPTGELREKLGDVALVIKVSKSPLEKDLQGVSIYANGVWHETTLAGCEGREMAQYLFGEIEVPVLDEEEFPAPAFDLSRSMRLNPENELVQAVYAFVGQHLDQVRRELVEKDRQRRASEEAKKLARQASDIARIINEDFAAFRQKLQRVKAKSHGASDVMAVDQSRESGDDLIFGDLEPAEVISDVGGPGHGSGEGSGTQIPDLGPTVVPSASAEKRGRRAGGPQTGRKPTGGFRVEFDHNGVESDRALYVRDERTIYINLDHPQIAAARGLGATEEPAFRRLAYEVAFSEYAVALASELAARDEYLDPSDPIVDIRETLNRVARKAASLYT